MKIMINQEFRVPRSWKASTEDDFFALCRGRHKTGINSNRGIFYYASLSAWNGHTRIPAFILYIDNVRGISEKNPWLDIIDTDSGYALYHGDNKTPGANPLSSDGNRKIAEITHQYRDANLRMLAPPMILFERANTHGKSFRKFVGYGIPRELRIQSQRSRQATFSNLVIELILFNLTAESEKFDWNWIDDRRDESISPAHALESAPVAWQRWVQQGDEALETSRRRVFGATIQRPKDQLRDVSCADMDLITKIHEFYQSNAYAFEGLASWVTSKVLGSSCSRGWVTPRIDGGIDFVSRLDLGRDFSKTVVVVLGQAKCINPRSSVTGIDLARTVARLKRGWIGVVVTTGTFSVKAQQEVQSDQYPLVLINGARLVQAVRAEMVEKESQLNDVLERETVWYEEHQRELAPDRMAFGDHWGQKPLDTSVCSVSLEDVPETGSIA